MDCTAYPWPLLLANVVIFLENRVISIQKQNKCNSLYFLLDALKTPENGLNGRERPWMPRCMVWCSHRRFLFRICRSIRPRRHRGRLHQTGA